MAHFETACADTGGENTAPICAYVPRASQTDLKGAGGDMRETINRQFITVNRGFLHSANSTTHYQRMVETMAARLRSLMEADELSYEKFGEIAGVSSTAVMKWMKGGDATDHRLAKIAHHYRAQGITVRWLRYGTAEKVSEPEADYDGLSPLAIDVAKRWMALSPDRQDWFRDLIFTTHFVEKRFPAMRKGRPKGEHYANLERAIEQNMRQLKLKLD